MPFSSSHGDVNAYWKGKLLIVEPKSTFNVDGIIAAANTIKQLVDERNQEEWVRVVVFGSEMIVGPVEGAKYIVDSFQYSRENGCKLVCVVGGNAINKDSFTKICEVVDLPLYFFDKLEDLELFISRCGTLMDFQN